MTTRVSSDQDEIDGLLKEFDEEMQQAGLEAAGVRLELSPANRDDTQAFLSWRVAARGGLALHVEYVRNGTVVLAKPIRSASAEHRREAWDKLPSLLVVIAQKLAATATRYSNMSSVALQLLKNAKREDAARR